MEHIGAAISSQKVDVNAKDEEVTTPTNDCFSCVTTATYLHLLKAPKLKRGHGGNNPMKQIGDIEICSVCQCVQVVHVGRPDEFHPLTRRTLFPAGNAWCRINQKEVDEQGNNQQNPHKEPIDQSRTHSVPPVDIQLRLIL